MKKITTLTILLFSLFTLPAAIKMPALFHDGMVLQRNSENRIWGNTTEGGQQLTLSFAGKTITTTSDNDGCFIFHLIGLNLSHEPQILKITDGNTTIEIKDVLVGDVFLLSGQSNMAWKIKQLGNPYTDNAKKDADYPNVRYYAVAKNLDTDFEHIYGNNGVPDKPWVKTSVETVSEYSAVGFYFGRKLYKEKQIPIGLIDCSQGSSYAEAWISQNYIDRHPHLKPALVPAAPSGNAQHYRNPGILYQNMLSRVLPYTVCGVLWYQGEANTPYYMNYPKVLPAVIDCFRESFQNPELPFIIIQLSGYENPDFWPYVRETQDSVASATPHTAMISTIDLGEADRIHPRDKEPVGERCVLAVRNMIYEESVGFSGPSFRSIRMEGNKAIITFDHADGLHSKANITDGFEICDRSYHYRPITNAEIKGNEITVWNSTLAQPVAVRYAWSNFPPKNLYNAEGLPANPFRTSKNPPVTAPAVYYIVPGGSGQQTGYDWENALDLTSDALKLGKSGDQFWVKAGTYRTHIQYSGRSLYGGFNGTETKLDERNWAHNLTILQGEEGATAPLAVVQTSAILDGFILQDNQLAPTAAASKNGGGIQLGSKTTVRNCIIRNNSTVGINDNTLGGGVYVSGKDEYGTYPIIENCLITNNAAPNNGGGIQLGNGASLRLISSTIADNMIMKNSGDAGSGYGCGVGLGDNAKLIAENCIVYNNRKPDGTTFSFGTNHNGKTNTLSTVRNCAYDNLHSGNETTGSVLFKETTDCISDLSASKTPDFRQPLHFAGTASSHSDYYPAFATADYSLSPGSICIDAGRGSASLSKKDLAGNDRKQGATIDIGAYETAPGSTVADTQATPYFAYYIQQGILTLTGIKQNKHITIYNIDGKRIYSTIADSDKLSIMLPSRGVYLITNDGQTQKVLY